MSSFKIKREIYTGTKYICQCRCPIESTSNIDLDYYHDLIIDTGVNNLCLISSYDTRSQNVIRYSFMYGNKVFDHSIEIDFGEGHKQGLILKEYIKIYRPKFERILDQAKIRIERDNVKKLLNNI